VKTKVIASKCCRYKGTGIEKTSPNSPKKNNSPHKTNLKKHKQQLTQNQSNSSTKIKTKKQKQKSKKKMIIIQT
jgi:hypothetical protein